jgi:hypothetical protein
VSKLYNCTIARDSLIDMEVKTTPHRFYQKPQKHRTVFNTKFNFQNLEKNQKLSGFSSLSIGLSGLWIGFWLVFYLKFKIWMKNGKPTCFSSLSFGFPDFLLKNQNLKFWIITDWFSVNRWNWSRSVLSVFTKPASFHRYCNTWL